MWKWFTRTSSIKIKLLPLVNTLICACKHNAVCLISSQWKENLLQIQSMIQQEIKPFKNGWTNGPRVMEENAQNGKSESLTWFKYDFLFFGSKAPRSDIISVFKNSARWELPESELNTEKIYIFLIRKKNNSIFGRRKISENPYICESPFSI